MKVKDKITRFYTIEDMEEILDKLPYQIWLKDDEKKYIYINKLGAEKLGISKEEIIGKTDYEFREYDIAKECDKTDIEVIEKKEECEGTEKTTIEINKKDEEPKKEATKKEKDDLEKTVKVESAVKDKKKSE